MNNGFDHDQLQKDWEDFLGFFTGFAKSFGPKPKKVKDQEIGFFEEMYIRFRLSLVDMGISKIIRTVLVIIVGLIVFGTLFRNATMEMKLIIVIGFIMYYVWQMNDHLIVDKKPVDTTAKILVGVHDFGHEVIQGIKGLFGGIFDALNPFPKEKK